MLPVKSLPLLLWVTHSGQVIFGLYLSPSYFGIWFLIINSTDSNVIQTVKEEVRGKLLGTV